LLRTLAATFKFPHSWKIELQYKLMINFTLCKCSCCLPVFSQRSTYFASY